MYLTTFDPFARDLQRRVSRNPFGQFAAMPLDVVRHDGDVTLRFDVPGIDPASIDVTALRPMLKNDAWIEQTRAQLARELSQLVTGAGRLR